MSYDFLINKLCKSREISISVAESCTSGLIASKLSIYQGSSIFFKGGIIAYQNEVKINLLNVDKNLILKYTEVSPQVAKSMAKGVRQIFKSDYSIATSGYAGPFGGTEDNPIGTVFVAINSKNQIIYNKFNFEGNRLNIINKATEKAIELLYNTIKKSI